MAKRASRKTAKKAAPRRRIKAPEKLRREYLPGYVWRQDKVDRVVKFIETFCKHTQGDQAGKPFTLLDWQREEVIAPLYGWYTPEGNRRFRSSAIWISKKNGKSTLISALCCYELIAAGEMGANVFSAANDRYQAGIVARSMIGMLKMNPALLKHVEIVESRNSVLHRASNSRYTVLSADAHRAEGIDASFCVVDEIHSMPNDKLFRALKYATAARTNPLFISISTAGYDKRGIWWESWKESEQNMADPSLAPAFYGRIWAAGKDDDPESEETWKKANPSLGHTISLTSFAADEQESRNSPSKRNSWLRYRLNSPDTTADERWFRPGDWQRCQNPPVPFGDRPVFCGVDLGSTWDTTSFVAISKDDDGVLDVHAKFFVPRDNAFEREQKDKVPYSAWVEQGHMIATQGNTCDYNVLQAYIEEFCKNNNVISVAFDRWNASMLMNNLYQQSIPVIGFNQSFSSLSAPSKRLETLVASAKLRVGDNPVLAWQADNVVVLEDNNQNIRPSKKHSTEKIDGIVSLVMAIGVLDTAEAQAENNYEIYWI